MDTPARTSTRALAGVLLAALLAATPLLPAVPAAAAPGAAGTSAAGSVVHHYGRAVPRDAAPVPDTPAAPAPAAAPTAPVPVVDSIPPGAITGPSTPAIPADAVRIAPDADAAAVVAAHPAGTTFVFESGIHRGVRIGVRSGDTYLGAQGAVLDGTRELDLSAFVREGSVYRATGIASDAQTGGSRSCAPWYEGGMARCGHEQEVFRSEMLFADGQRLRHVNSVDQVTAGTWHYHAGTRTVTVGQLPSRLEMSVADFAFAGWGAAAVRIEGLHIDRYASPAQMGAIDALGTTGWTVHGVAVTRSHGYGIRIGRSMTVTRSLIADNGHLGLGGSAEDTGFVGTHNVVAGNGWLGIQPAFELGGVKLLFTDGAVVTHNHIHDNHAKGLWFDGYNRNATIAHNRIERSGQTGLLYEISYSAVIRDNALIDNHTSGDTSESYGNLQIVDSQDVEVRNNLLQGGGAQELTIYANGHHPGVANIRIRDNAVTIDTGWAEGTYGLKDLRPNRTEPLRGIQFANNHVLLRQAPPAPFAWDGQLVAPAQWAAAHPDVVRS